jgi:hypothetical protein
MKRRNERTIASLAPVVAIAATLPPLVVIAFMFVTFDLEPRRQIGGIPLVTVALLVGAASAPLAIVAGITALVTNGRDGTHRVRRALVATSAIIVGGLEAFLLYGISD